MHKENKDIQLCEFIIQKLDGTISIENNQKLIEILRSSPDAQALYNEMIILYAAIATPGKIAMKDSSSPSPGQLDILLNDLAHVEKVAPAMAIKKSKNIIVANVEKAAVEKTVRQINKTSLAAAFLSMAALLLMIAYVLLNPNVSNEVATITETVKLEGSTELKKGLRISSRPQPYFLSKGVVKIVSDKDVEIFIEGPSEFRFDSVSEIVLNSGRLYSKVSGEGLGFSVTTSNTKIIDLGTEFGVFSFPNHSTELHVFKGKTNLVTLENNHIKYSQMVDGGDACKVGSTADIQSIQLNKTGFIRDLNASTQTVWRGEDISLADFVGGGNGLGTGIPDMGITYQGTIKMLDTNTSSDGPTVFVSLDQNEYINGVFIPNGPTQITSDGLVHHFYKTNGRYWLGILNGAWHKVSVTSQIPRHNLRLNGDIYGIPGHPAIYMAANQGITFDLNAIRKHSFSDIEAFKAICGVSETYNDYLHLMDKNLFSMSPKADFYVIVDGVVRYERKDSFPGEPAQNINVRINPEDRFLTLVTMQGSDGTNNGDWTLFAEPVLQLK